MNRLNDILHGKIMPGMYRFSSVAAQQRARREVEQAGYAFFYLDGRAFNDKAGFLKAAARAFNFPESYGANWDAFEEGVRDLSWARNPGAGAIAPKGFVVLFDEVSRFAKASPQDWTVAREILEGATKQWRESGLPMFVLLRGAFVVAADLDLL